MCVWGGGGGGTKKNMYSNNNNSACLLNILANRVVLSAPNKCAV